MNIFLQFKQKNHSQAYSYDLQLQITKRLIMVIIWAVISFVGTVAVFSISKSVSMSAYEITKNAVVVVCVVVGCFLRCNLQWTRKYAGKINFVLDLCLIWAQFQLFPYLNRDLIAAYGKLAVFLAAWSACLACYAIYFAIQSWWLKIIVPVAQIIYFVIPTVQEEIFFWPIVVVFATQCILIYVSFIYVSELYQRKDFLEKRKVYENYEAIMRIFDDINQGVMIVDPGYKMIYSNRTIDSMFGQPRDNPSLRNLFSQLQVKSITPRLESSATEQIHMTRENEDSVNI